MECKPYGNCDSGIVHLKSMPSEREARCSKLFGDISSRQKFIPILCNEILPNIDFENDCYITSILKERPKNGKFPRKKPKEEIIITENEIKQRNPVVIIAYGKDAIKFALPDCPSDRMSDFKMHGRAMYSNKFDCLVGCTLTEAISPDYLMWTFKDIIKIFEIFEQDNYKLPDFDFNHGNVIIDNTRENGVAEFESVVTRLIDENKPVAFDYECSDVDPFKDGVELYSISLCNDTKIGYGIPLSFKNHWSDIELAFIETHIRRLLESSVPKIIQNAEFETVWSKQLINADVCNVIYDTMIGYHVIDDRQGICSLDFQTFEICGRSYKNMVNIKKLCDETTENLLTYNIIDSRITLKLYEIRKKYIEKNLWTKKPTDFFMKALPVLSSMKQTGIAVDMTELEKQHNHVSAKIKTLFNDIQKLDIIADFKSKYDRDILLTSSRDLKLLFFEQLKLKPTKYTDKGNISLDAEALEEMAKKKNMPKPVASFMTALTELRQYEKLMSTYLEPYKQHTQCSNIIHPTCALHTTRSYRSSYLNPNLQNIPVRSEKGKEIRKAFIPQNDFFLDIDVKGAELRVVAMYSGDPTLLAELKAGIDVHRKWSAKLFKVSENEITKQQRADVKTNFIFLSIYGGSVAAASYGLGLSKSHVSKIAREFWITYPELKRWQAVVKKKYIREGFVELATGFRRHGPIKARAQINTPVQGMSFHFVLNAMIEIHAEMTQRKLLSKIVLQVHDEILIDVVENEADEIINIVNSVFEYDYFPKFSRGLLMEIDWSYGKNFGELQKL